MTTTPTDALLEELRTLSESVDYPDTFVINNVLLVIRRSKSSPNTVKLFRIRAYDKGKGFGTGVMKLLTASADKHRITITLEPVPEEVEQKKEKPFRAATKRLCEWYRRFGFTGSMTVMIRPPQ